MKTLFTPILYHHIYPEYYTYEGPIGKMIESYDIERSAIPFVSEWARDVLINEVKNSVDVNNAFPLRVIVYCLSDAHFHHIDIEIWFVPNEVAYPPVVGAQDLTAAYAIIKAVWLVISPHLGFIIKALLVAYIVTLVSSILTTSSTNPGTTPSLLESIPTYFLLVGVAGLISAVAYLKWGRKK